MARVASCLRGALAGFPPNMDEDSASDEETPAPSSRNNISTTGNLCTVDNTVINQITWPHELLYTCAGEPAVYEKLTSIACVNACLTVMVGQSGFTKASMLIHLQ